MSGFLNRFRYFLTYALMAALCVAALASGYDPRDLGLASRLIMKLTLPIERMVSFPIEEAKDGLRALAELTRVHSENLELRGKVAALREENLRYREDLVSSERYQRLRSFQVNQEIAMAPANVVHRDPSSWFRSVVIDQGGDSGLRAGMPVITDSGVVGVVSSVAPDASKVLLLIDPQSRIDAYVQRSRARGSVRGTSNREADFEYVLRGDDVLEGDLLLTSGLGSIYPKGLLIGAVQDVESQPHGLFQRVRVAPAVDFQRLEEVFVLLERRQLPPEEAFVQSGEGLWPERAP